MSWKIESAVEKAIEDGVLPGAVMFAKDKSGKLNYAKAIGQSSLDPSSPQPMHLDTVFTLASMTKLLTIIAVLQLVDRGLISLDEDVTKHLPALGAHPILTGFTPDGEPITTPRTRPITLRHLLTHSSGCGYAFLDPSLQTYISRPGSTFCNPTSTESTAARFDHPLLFEPGTGWAYGCSIDWAGELVPALTGVDLETHLQQHILSPLSLPQGSITFYPEHHHHESHTPSPKLACMTARSATTNRVEHSPFPLPSPSVDPHSPSEKRRAHFGGEAGYASLQSYISILHSLLLDDGKLLTPQTAAELFKPQLEPGAKEALLANVKNPFWIVGWVPDTGEYDWSLAGLLVDGDGHPLRRKGYLAWAGVFNLNWFIDRTTGICGIFGTQISNPADPLVRPLMKEFEEEIYEKLKDGSDTSLSGKF